MDFEIREPKDLDSSSPEPAIFRPRGIRGWSDEEQRLFGMDLLGFDLARIAKALGTDVADVEARLDSIYGYLGVEAGDSGPDATVRAHDAFDRLCQEERDQSGQVGNVATTGHVINMDDFRNQLPVDASE